jgi:hypothetical protein
MSADKLMRYKCQACGVVCLCDLRPDEMKVCPLCGTPEHVRATSGELAQCQCGALIQADDCDRCGDCLTPLCSECSHENPSAACSLCQRILDARQLIASVQ